MMRSFWTAVTGLVGHQTYTDVVADNLANINTIGYQRSRVDLQTTGSHIKRSGTPPTEERGGINAAEVGAGLNVGSISRVFTQGSLQATGRVTDLAIEGDGYLVLDDGTETRKYTRDGALQIDANGNLNHMGTGLQLLGYYPGPEGEIDRTAAPTSMQVPVGNAQATATTSVSLAGNLDSLMPDAGSFTTTLAFYDSLGEQHNVTLTFSPGGAPGSLAWVATTTDSTISSVTPAGTGLTFETDGSFSLTNPATSLELTLANGSGTPQTIEFDMSRLTRLAQESNVTEAAQDGLPLGTLTGISIDDTGVVAGLYSNGLKTEIAQLALANFVNPSGLLSVGQNLYRPWLNSGEPQLGAPGDDNFGTTASGHLEGSNVDLANEFTNLILARRGFQANSRVVTTSDEMIRELLNMKR